MSDPPVQTDSLRGLRGIFAGTLVMEAIVVGLIRALQLDSVDVAIDTATSDTGAS